MDKKLKENKHHIISQCKREEYNVHDPRNVKRMLEIQHTALHQLFRALHTTKDQLQKLRDMFAPILSPLAQNIFDELLKLSNEQFYDT